MKATAEDRGDEEVVRRRYGFQVPRFLSSFPRRLALSILGLQCFQRSLQSFKTRTEFSPPPITFAGPADGIIPDTTQYGSSEHETLSD